MKAKHRTKRIQRYRKMLGIIVLMLTITLIGVVVSATVLYKRKNACKTPDTTLVEYPGTAWAGHPAYDRY